MDLRETIYTNGEIMRLVRSKYDDVFPGAYNTPEARYYRILAQDSTRAQGALAHRGLSERRDDTIYSAPV